METNGNPHGNNGPVSDPDAERAVKERMEDYMAAYNSGDLEKLSTLYSTDCYFVAPERRFIRGREGVLKCGILKQMMDLGGSRLEIRPDDFVAGPNSVSLVAAFSLYDDSGKEIDDGRLVNVWVKTGTEWLLKYDIFN